MYFKDWKHYIHYLINNKQCIIIREEMEFIENSFKEELGIGIYDSLKEQYNNRHNIFKNNNTAINIYSHMEKTLRGIYARKQLLITVEISYLYPLIYDDVGLEKIKENISWEINKMYDNLSIYVKKAREMFCKKRDDPSLINLTAWECFSIFNALIVNDKYPSEEYNNARQKILINLWNHASDKDKQAVINHKEILERIQYWEIPIINK